MSGRYSKLFALSENLYAAGAPVVIAAGALLKDNQTGNVLAQLKFKSISSCAIKAITVRLSVNDAAGRAIGEPVEHQYLDLALERDGETGQKEPVLLPNAMIRSFGPEVTEVIFTDNSIWSATGEPWEPLPPIQLLNGYLSSFELAEQYRIQFGEPRYTMVPEEHGDLWYCACGAVNRSSEQQHCHTCGRAFQTLRDALDPTVLSEASDARLKKEAQEKEAREAAEREKKEAREAAKREAAAIRGKKAKKVFAIAVPILCAVIVLAVVTKKVIIPAKHNSDAYKAAEELLAEADYDGAVKAFSALGDYKDSPERVMEVIYTQAEELLAEADYDGAISVFSELGDYKDSPERVTEAEAAKQEAINATNYEQAEKLLAEENYSGAIAVLSKLGDYKDSAERLLEIQKAEYEKAEDCFEAGDYDKAISGFSALGDYEDSAEKVQEVHAKIENVLQPIRKALEEDMAEGYNMLKKLPVSFDAATELLSQCKPFIPYCGRYRLKGSTTEFVSKFSLKNGMVYWLPDFGEATSIQLTSGSKVLHTYWEKPTAVDTEIEIMSTSESYVDSDGQKYTFTAEFVSGNQIEMRKPYGDILTFVKLDEVLA